MRALGIDIGGSAIKVCLIDAGQRRTSQSEPYRDPGRRELAGAIGSAVSGFGLAPGALPPIGLCLPGKRHGSGEFIERSVNLPCLDGWRFDDLLGEALGAQPGRFTVVTDAHAGAHDWFCAHHPGGRTACIAIGTGVGLCVLDDGEPVGIGDRAIGHLGFMDIGRLGERDTVGGDGAINTLESYVGAGALRARIGPRVGDDPGGLLAGLVDADPFIIALVRAMRVVHAIYVPDTIVLMGGVGIALRARGEGLHARVSEGLTSLARPDWRLCFGDSLFHAASGAARLALAGV